MSEKGLFASICGFFKGLFSSEAVQSSAPAPASSASSNNDGLTSVERYIRNKESVADQVTSVERYIRNKAATSEVITSVEQYIRNKG